MQPISEKIVKALPIPEKGNKVHFFSGASVQGKKAPSGFGVRVTAGGTKSFVLFHRQDGRKFLETLGRWDENPQGGTLTVRDAIIRASETAKAIKNGKREDPRPERTRRIEDGTKSDGLLIGGAWEGEEKAREIGAQKRPGMLDIFIERYVEKDAQLRTADQIKETFRRLVAPEIGDLGIYEIRRSHVVEMLDEIADESGPVMADRALAFFRKACNWYAARDDEFNPPIVKGMARTKPRERARKRILDDQEIRDVWAALNIIEDVPAFYPRFVKLTLLTAARRSEAAGIHASEISGDLWIIPAERYKTKLPHVVPLTTDAVAQLGKIEKDAGYLFSSTGGTKAFSGFSKSKRKLDEAIAKVRKGRGEMAPFTVHDLRRTARSLMSRAKVPADHAERALGHVIGGVRETYDRYEYLDEKRAAFEALAALVDRILNPASNVTELRGAAAHV